MLIGRKRKNWNRSDVWTRTIAGHRCIIRKEDGNSHYTISVEDRFPSLIGYATWKSAAEACKELAYNGDSYCSDWFRSDEGRYANGCERPVVESPHGLIDSTRSF